MAPDPILEAEIRGFRAARDAARTICDELTSRFGTSGSAQEAAKRIVELQPDEWIHLTEEQKPMADLPYGPDTSVLAGFAVIKLGLGPKFPYMLDHKPLVDGEHLEILWPDDERSVHRVNVHQRDGRPSAVNIVLTHHGAIVQACLTPMLLARRIKTRKCPYCRMPLIVDGPNVFATDKDPG